MGSFMRSVIRFVRSIGFGFSQWARGGVLPEFHPALPLDALDHHVAEVSFRVRHGDQAFLGRVIEVVMVAVDTLQFPPIGFDLLDDFPAADHVCLFRILTYQLYNYRRGESIRIMHKLYNYLRGEKG
jgi:hypothetical protein